MTMKSTTVCAQIHQKRPFLSLLLAAALLITCASCGTDPVIRRIRQNGGLKVGYCSCAPSEDAPFVIAGDSGSSGITAEPAAEIAQGMEAVFQWRYLDREDHTEDLDKIYEDLKAYCSMDTYAMTVVYQWLKNMVKE